VAPRIAFVFPGQGSHRPDMASAFGSAGRAVVERLGRAAGLDLAALADDADACAATSIGQPALLATSLAALVALADAGIQPDVVAGHSLGEVTAAVAAGAIGPDDGARVVAERGRAMGAACAATPGGMAAVVRVDLAEVAEVLRNHPEVAIANNNAPGQLVLAGPVRALADALDDVGRVGGRAIPLRVEGAFHSPAMAPAVVALAQALERVPMSDPTVPLITGVSGQVLHRGDDVKRNLVDGILAPVRWVAVFDQLIAMGTEVLVEVGPGGVLAALARRADRGLVVHSVARTQDVADLAASLGQPTALVTV